MQPVPQDYGRLLGEIKERIRSAQYEALRKVNTELISHYWDIGRLIVDRQQNAGWGKSVVENLAEDLQAEFPGISGFSAANLWRMRLFYDTYADNEKLAPMVREIGWSHNLLIMEKCKEDLAREFYLRMTRGHGWTKNVLTHQIENKTYEKTMLGQTNFEETLPEEIRGQAKLAVKDEYTFDFLELGDELATHDDQESRQDATRSGGVRHHKHPVQALRADSRTTVESIICLFCRMAAHLVRYGRRRSATQRGRGA